MSSGDTIPNCLGEFREIRESKERTRGRKRPTTLPLCQKVGGPSAPFQERVSACSRGPATNRASATAGAGRRYRLYGL